MEIFILQKREKVSSVITRSERLLVIHLLTGGGERDVSSKLEGRIHGTKCSFFFRSCSMDAVCNFHLRVAIRISSLLDDRDHESAQCGKGWAPI